MCLRYGFLNLGGNVYMKINLAPEIVDEMMKALNKGLVFNFKYEGKDFYTRMDEVRFPERMTKIELPMTVKQHEDAVAEEIVAGPGSDYIFTTIARNRIPEIYALKKMISVFFFTNDKYDSTFPYDLIRADECDVNIKINHDKLD